LFPPIGIVRDQIMLTARQPVINRPTSKTMNVIRNESMAAGSFHETAGAKAEPLERVAGLVRHSNAQPGSVGRIEAGGANPPR
jgi:hypothetical protein